MISLAPLSGSPDVAETLASSLQEAARTIGAAEGALSLVRPGAAWDTPAGRAFEARVQSLPHGLGLMAERYAGAAAALRAFAAEFREAQLVCTREAVAHAELSRSAEHLMASIDARGVPATEGDRAEVGVMERRRQEAILQMQASERRYAAAYERYQGADRRCAAVLDGLSHDSLDDSLVYRGMTGVQGGAGSVAQSVGAASLVMPELAPVAAIAGGVALGADVGVKAVLGEGSWRAIGTEAGMSAMGVGGTLLKKSGVTSGAISGRHRAAGRPTATELLAKGGRDYLKNPPWKLAPVDESRLRIPAAFGPREPLSRRLRAAITKAADKAVLDDWRAATANGRNGQAMLAASYGVKGAEKALTAYPKVKDALDRRHDTVGTADGTQAPADREPVHGKAP